MKKFYLLTIIFLAAITLQGKPTDLDSLSSAKNGAATAAHSIKKVESLKPFNVSRTLVHRHPVPFANFERIAFAHAFTRSFDDSAFETVTELEADPILWGDFRPAAHINQDSVDIHIGEALTLLEDVKQKGRLIDMLTADMTFQLPVGISKSIGGLGYTVIFHKLKLTETNAYVDAYLIIETPKKKIAFMGRGIEFSAEGGITGAGRLELLGNANFELNNKETIITLLGGSDPTEPSPTYAEFDCYGFKELSIAADITFSKDLFKKENPDGSLSEDRVVTHFNTKVADWNNILVEVSLPKFQLAKLEGWSFEVQSAVLDFSDEVNSTNMIFPEGYDSPYFIDGTKKLWRGFYLKELSVTLPEEFKKKGNNERTSIFAYDILIDQSGFTGGFAVTNILTLDEGSASSWKMSVDSLHAYFQQNEFVSAGISGELVVPSLDSDQPLLYTGTILGAGNYQLMAKLQDKAKFDIFKADLNLTADSYIELKVESGKFKPKAVLHGNLDLAPPSKSGKTAAEVKGVKFQSLVLQTEAPYIAAEYFGFENPTSENKAGGFPIGINALALRTEDNKVGIFADITVNLVKADDSGFGAEAGFTIWAKREMLENREVYRYDKIELSKIAVDVSRPGFSIYGALTFYEGDNTYGDGFRGEVQAKFSKIDVSAVALFGRVNGMRYWYVDALVEWKSGLPVIAPFALNGIGGGAFYHMRQQGLNENLGSELGKSTSGIIYVPDPTFHLGIKASVTFSIQNAESTANGNAEFSIAFNSSGGVNQVAFNGGVEIMTGTFTSSLDKVQETASLVSNQEAVESNASSAIRGEVNLLFDNQNDTFHGEISMYVNVAGGIMKGSGPQNLAGRAVIHFAPNEWYIHIGNPEVPIGIKVLGLAELQGYFMVGHNIPGMPPPPQLVLDILTADQRADNERIRNTSRALGETSSGKGFAFGARFSVDTGDKKFLMFYGQFAATAGFDINMRQLNATCAGRSGLVGINGWYAEGQAYFGMVATIGMKVNLRFIKKNVEIFHGELAALMQVKGPNPFWMRGDAAGRFSVLGGLVKGSFDFTVTIGEECELEPLDGGNPLEDVQVIAQLTPSSGAEEVDVFTSPQAVFNIPVNKVFRLNDLNGESMSFKAELEYFRLKQGANILESETQFNSDHDVLVLQPVNILPDEKNLTLEISIIFKEYIDGNWTAIKEDGVSMTEKLSINFKSGPQPDFIPEHMVANMYPLKGMINFYQDESDDGYIKLNQGGLTRPFDTEGGKWKLEASFTDEDGEKYREEFSYNSSNQKVSFKIPTLANEKILHFQLLRTPSQTSAAIDANVSKRTDKVQLDATLASKDIEFEVQTNEAIGTIENLEEKEVYGYFLRSSAFNTLQEKFNAPTYYNYNSGAKYQIQPRVHSLLYGFLGGKEIFSPKETSNFNSLIAFKFSTSGNSWYEKDIYPLLYEHTGESNQNILSSYYISQYTYLANFDQAAEYNQSIYTYVQPFAVIYNVPYAAFSEYVRIKNNIADKYKSQSNKPQWVENLLSSDFPMVRKGFYNTKATYTLPDGSKGKSDFIFKFYNSTGAE